MIVIILILAFFVRVYDLSLFPLNHDEANWIIRCVDNFDSFLCVPVSCFNGYIRPFLSYLVFFSRAFFSSPEYAVRIPAAIIGVITIILVYKMAKEMYGQKAGLVSSLLLAFLPWHVIQSRDGREMITTPFFGCLIFLSLIIAIRKESNLWFLLSWFFLAVGSFYAYSLSVLFVPIFIAILLVLRKNFRWVKTRIFLLAVLIFFITIYPLLWLQVTNQIPRYLSKFYWYYYKDGPFTNSDSIYTFLSQSLKNFKNNILVAIETIFFASRGRMLYAATLESPFLITKSALFIVLFSIIISIRRKQTSDKILLIWLVLGFLGSVSGVRFFQSRHLFIILIPLLILMGRCIAEIFNLAQATNFLKQKSLIIAGAAICIGLVFIEVFQLARHYIIAPTNFEECRRNSYGCKEAAQYLMQIAGLRSWQIIADNRMTVSTYFEYFKRKKIADSKINTLVSPTEKYYVIWAPESHPLDYWEGSFRGLYDYFRKRYPTSIPLKTIYYPNELAAIHIFRVERDSIEYED